MYFIPFNTLCALSYYNLIWFPDKGCKLIAITLLNFQSSDSSHIMYVLDTYASKV